MLFILMCPRQVQLMMRVLIQWMERKGIWQMRKITVRAKRQWHRWMGGGRKKRGRRKMRWSHQMGQGRRERRGKRRKWRVVWHRPSHYSRRFMTQ